MRTPNPPIQRTALRAAVDRHRVRPMGTAWALAALVASGALGCGDDGEFDRGDAIRVAKAAVQEKGIGRRRGSETVVVEYSAGREGDHWNVHATMFHERDGQKIGYPGGHATIIVDLHGNVVEYIGGM